jgi:excisionase family DNA binding protein
MEDELELLTIEEASNLLKVNKATLRRWTDNNLLPCQRIGPRKERRFQRIDLIDFLSNNLENQTSPQPLNKPHRSSFDQSSTKPNHISSYYNNTIEQWAILKPFLLEHSQPNCHIIYLHNSDETTIKKEFDQNGFDNNTLILNGTLELYHTNDSYLINDVFIANRMFEFWQERIATVQSKGINKIFLTGEMGWALQEKPGCENLHVYEAQLNKLLQNLPEVTVLCQYSLTEFSSQDILESVCTHPHLQIKNQLLKITHL